MADKLPWGLKSEGISPGSMKMISENKLKAFNVGSMNLKKGLNKKEQEEHRKKQQAQEAAEVYKEFVESFEDSGKRINRAWVKGGVVNPDKSAKADKGKLYRPTSKLAELASSFKSSPDSKPKDDSKPPVPGKKKEIKKKSNLEIFKEELIAMQKERQERREMKHAMGFVDEEGRKTRFDSPDNSAGRTEDYRGAGYNYVDDTQTTNLYLGNINPKMSEQELCETFGKYGPLASVKIMWPRSDEERNRGRNCGFVAFMNRKDGERALAALQGKEIMEFEMKLGWGKAVPIPPHPFYIPPRLAELTLPPPPSGLPFNAQPHRRSRLTEKPASSKPSESSDEFDKTVANAVVKVVIPTERNLLCIIHRMVEFVVREGPMFEAMIMNREINNPLFRFLFENQSPAHVYYRWKLYSILQGDSTHKWQTEDFRMFKHGSYWRPPTLNPYTQGMPEELVGDKSDQQKKGQLSESQRDRLEDMLRELSPERLRVGDAMIWCLEHAESAEEIVECITESLSILQTPIPKKIARLYLISDILYNCSAKVPNASSFRRYFEPKLAEIFKDIHEAYDKIEARLRAEQFKQRVMSCFRAWEDWTVYPNDHLIRLQNIFLGLVPYKADDEMMPKEDLDGAPLDVDGTPLDDLDGMPLDGEMLNKSAASTSAEKDDYDGKPLVDVEGSPFIEELYGSLEKPEFEGKAIFDEKPMTKFKYEPSKWESVDETQLEAQAMTTSKWDMLEQESNGDKAEEEDIDGQPYEAEPVQGSPLQRYMQEYDSPEPQSREESPALGTAAHRERLSELKRAKLREIELKVVKYQDEVEAGKRSRKSDMSMAEQLQYYRNKLLQKEEDKERERDREREREKRWEEERERVKEWERAREKDREREARERVPDRRERDRDREGRRERDNQRRERERSSSSDGGYSEAVSFPGGLVQYGSRSPSVSPSRSARSSNRAPASPPAAYRDISPSPRRRRSRSRTPKKRGRRSRSPRFSRTGSPKRSRRSRSSSRSPSRQRHKHKKSKY